MNTEIHVDNRTADQVFGNVDKIQRSIKYWRLWIDDIRTPTDSGFTIARSSFEAIDLMDMKGCPSFISFDHDLGEDDTSMRVVNWLIKTDLDMDGKFIPEDFSFHVHSANPVGRQNIEGKLSGYLLFRIQKTNLFKQLPLRD